MGYWTVTQVRLATDSSLAKHVYWVRFTGILWYKYSSLLSQSFLYAQWVHLQLPSVELLDKFYQLMGGTLYDLRMATMAVRSTELYALDRSIKQRYTGVWYSATFSTTWLVTHIWSTVLCPLLNPHWVSISCGSMMVWSRSRRISASTFPGTLRS